MSRGADPYSPGTGDRPDWAAPGMNLMDVVPWMLYSKYELQAGEQVPSNIELANDIIWEKWPVQTNLTMAQKLPAPKTFQIRSIHAVYSQTDEEDKETLRWRYILELHLGQKIYHQAPLCGLHDGIRLIEVRRRGQPQVPGYFPDDGFLMIPHQMTFRIRLVGKTFRLQYPGRGMKFMVVLNGMMARAVC